MRPRYGVTRRKRMVYTQEGLLERLQRGIAFVEYKKLDGEKRKMDCTLDPLLVPKTARHKTKRPEGLITAWDVDRGVWRSFYVENVLKVL